MSYLSIQIKDHWKSLLLSVVIIFVLKFIVFLFFGVTVEIDSYNYAFNALNFEYPPLYPYLLRFAHLIQPQFFVVVILQIFIFSTCGALFTNYFSIGCKQLIWLSVLLGLEPVSGFFCTDIMSEAIFISTLFIWVIVVHNFFSRDKFSYIIAGTIGVLCGVLYLERFAGILFLGIFFILSVFSSEHRKKIILTVLIGVIGFQLTLLPVRLKYNQVFGTYRINGVTGVMWWNNASVLYPGSSAQKNPETDFNKFVSRSDASTFNEYNAVKGRQLNEYKLPYRAFLIEKKITQENAPAISDQAGKMALNIIKENPIHYFTQFVWPNFTQYFFEDDFIWTKEYKQRFIVKYSPVEKLNWEITYSPFIYSAGWFLLIGCSLLYWKGKRSLLGKIILVSSWSYMFMLPFICIMAIRLNLVVMPLLVFLLILQLRRNSTKL